MQQGTLGPQLGGLGQLGTELSGGFFHFPGIWTGMTQRLDPTDLSTHTRLSVCLGLLSAATDFQEGAPGREEPESICQGALPYLRVTLRFTFAADMSRF